MVAVDGSDVVKLRDHIETLIRHEKELREAQHERDVEALRLQAVEYTRRLEALNQSHERMDKVQGSTVSRAMWEDRMERLDVWQRQTDLAITGMMPKADFETWRRTVDTRLAEDRGAYNRTMAILAVVLTLLGLILRFLPL